MITGRPDRGRRPSRATARPTPTTVGQQRLGVGIEKPALAEPGLTGPGHSTEALTPVPRSSARRAGVGQHERLGSYTARSSSAVSGPTEATLSTDPRPRVDHRRGEPDAQVDHGGHVHPTTVSSLFGSAPVLGPIVDRPALLIRMSTCNPSASTWAGSSAVFGARKIRRHNGSAVTQLPHQPGEQIGTTGGQHDVVAAYVQVPCDRGARCPTTHL